MTEAQQSQSRSFTYLAVYDYAPGPFLYLIYKFILHRGSPFSQHPLFATLPPFRNTFLTNLCFASGPLFATPHLIRKIFDPKIGKNGQK